MMINYNHIFNIVCSCSLKLSILFLLVLIVSCGKSSDGSKDTTSKNYDVFIVEGNENDTNYYSHYGRVFNLNCLNLSNDFKSRCLSESIKALSKGQHKICVFGPSLTPSPEVYKHCKAVE